jgi:uncharacterized protein (TIGR02996 family)
MSDEEALLAAIEQDPDDDATRLVYADWLEEQGDIRGEYLRLEHQLRTIPARLEELRARIDPGWLGRVGARRRLVLVSYDLSQKIAVIRLIREITGMGLAEAKALSEAQRPAIKDGLALAEARQLAARFDGIAQVGLEPSP